nr:hypothetical protein [Tanacetum cinerariifolium]
MSLSLTRRHHLHRDPAATVTATTTTNTTPPPTPPSKHPHSATLVNQPTPPLPSTPPSLSPHCHHPYRHRHPHNNTEHYILVTPLPPPSTTATIASPATS